MLNARPFFVLLAGLGIIFAHGFELLLTAHPEVPGQCWGLIVLCAAYNLCCLVIASWVGYGVAHRRANKPHTDQIDREMRELAQSLSDFHAVIRTRNRQMDAEQ